MVQLLILLMLIQKVFKVVARHACPQRICHLSDKQGARLLNQVHKIQARQTCACWRLYWDIRTLGTEHDVVPSLHSCSSR